jgi:hypothetical protein
VSIIVTLSVLGAVAGFAYMYRRNIYDQFPQVGAAGGPAGAGPSGAAGRRV